MDLIPIHANPMVENSDEYLRPTPEHAKHGDKNESTNEYVDLTDSM